jgi:iron complex transport system substrate-binding protein
MNINRRSVLSGIAATAVLPWIARAATSVTDAAGRPIDVPDRVERIFAAGPPASILLYTFAPDLLLGWTRSHEPAQCALLGAGACNKPEVGRLTGRGNTINFELLKLKPDLILDVGTVNDTYVSLANRVQEQTGIPYVLLDGRFDAIVTTYSQLGELTHRSSEAKEFAGYASETITTIKGRVEKIAEAQRPRVYYGRGPRGLETGLGGSINVETIEYLGARNVAAERQGGVATISVEQVLAWNPDVIITIEPNFAAACGTIRCGRPSRRCRPGAFICHRACRSPGWISRRR